MSFQPSLVRQALDELLRRYPMFDLVHIDWKRDEDMPSVWTLVHLGQASERQGGHPTWAVWHFAIFRATGALHTMATPIGPVSDDPIWTP